MTETLVEHENTRTIGTRTLRIVAADDHALVLAALHASFASSDGIDLVATARSGRELLALVEEVRPDAVLLDLHMPPPDGLTCLDRLRQQHPQIRVVVFSGTDDPSVVAEAMRRGASGYVVKAVDPRDLPSVLRQAVEGNVHLNVLDAPTTAPRELADLSDRETAVLQLLTRGLSNRQIARELWVAEQTVKFHLTNIYRKLGVANRTEAARFMYARGLSSAEQ